MKIIALFLTLFCVVECQEVNHRPIKRHHYSSKPSPAINPKQITSDQYSIIVPKAWITEYRNMEKDNWSIPEDSKIWQEGDRYHIPIEVAQHYIALSKP